MKLSSRICFVALAIATVLLSGCLSHTQKLESPPPVPSQPTGLPEVFIQGNVRAVKAALVAKMAPYYYTFEQDGEFMLRLSRPLLSGEKFAVSGMMGNTWVTSRRVTTFAFKNEPKGVRISVSSHVVLLSGDQVSGPEDTDASANYKTIQSDLNALKAEVERK